MKRFLVLILALLLLLSCCGCSSSSSTTIPTVQPLDTQAPDVTTDPSNSVEPLVPGQTGTSTAAPGDSAAPTGSAAATNGPAASPNPSSGAATAGPTAGSGTASPKVTSAAGTANQSSTTDVDVYSGWQSMVSNSSYIVIGTISKDVGVVDTLEGTETRKLAPNAYIGDWQYQMDVSQVLKTANTGKISRNTTITVSYPYERCMNIQTKPMEKDDSFVALTEKNTYVLFLDYDAELGFYTPAGFEPNKFSLSGTTLYILTGKDGLDIAWEAGAGKTGVSLSSLESACK